MNYVPLDWKTATYEHIVTLRKAGIFKRMLCCNCGLSGWSAKQLWNEHVRVEMDTRNWLQMIETKKAQRNQATEAQRQQNLAKYEEFKAGLRQNESPGSDSFYWS